ncbi:serine/threonine protein kinase [Haliangium sp.]|uniref:serine/threonine protein kinase n=1 Tax=Haliangium sp. TaxID=2663208 RepID=UPI003D135AF2
MASTSHDKRAGSDKLKPGSPSEPVPFGKYYLLGLIARGGMAEVYRARLRDASDPQIMAIKVMRPQLAREPRFVDMFNREGQLAMLLDNPCIVRTIEVSRVEGRHYIAMEYIPGRDLTQGLRRCQEQSQRFPVPHAVFVAARIAEGLAFAHQLHGTDGRPLNIVNRDVSPSNVRLSYDGDVKMLDFGIAQALMKFTSEIGVLKGKFSYMSPEQIRGMPLDARTDIFSTGIILHEMLTTEKLFRGDTEFALMEKVRKADVPPPSKFNRRVPEKLDAIVLKALARNVSDRYQSAADLQADLDELLESYRFNPKELRQFMRNQLFRKECAREQAELEISLRSLPASERAAAASASAPASHPPPAAQPPPSQRVARPSSPELRVTPSPVPTPHPDSLAPGSSPANGARPERARSDGAQPNSAGQAAPAGTGPEQDGSNGARKEGFWARIMRRKR